MRIGRHEILIERNVVVNLSGKPAVVVILVFPRSTASILHGRTLTRCIVLGGGEVVVTESVVIR